MPSNLQEVNSTHKSPLNTSTSKALYTFPKEERFPGYHDHLNDSFYENPSTLCKRAPSFGYGQKHDIAMKTCSPPPNQYVLGSAFTKSPKKGQSIGCSRQECKNISIFNNSITPGPGAYVTLPPKDGSIFTIKGKLQFPALFPKKEAPGPGAYCIQGTDCNGLCVTSKFRTSKGFKIHYNPLDKENSLILHDNSHLGPGTYNTVLSSTGKQILAKNKTQKSFHFARKSRETFETNSISPGPGAYQHFSMFSNASTIN